jgi:hypothetical protein
LRFVEDERIKPLPSNKAIHFVWEVKDSRLIEREFKKENILLCGNWSFRRIDEPPYHFILITGKTPDQNKWETQDVYLLCFDKNDNPQLLLKGLVKQKNIHLGISRKIRLGLTFSRFKHVEGAQP